jgi:hypothetical protein
LNPKSEDLWQRSLYSFTENSTTWYMDQPLGKNTLGNMLKTICKQSGLNYIYTNHSLRATSITVLDFNKFEARNIMAVSDDRSESSLKKYRNKPSKTRIHEMSTGLTSALINDVEKNENSYRSDAELPVVELENIEIDGEIFVNDTDVDNLMQAEGTNLPLIELQVQNVNPTVDELTVTGYSDKKLNTNPLKNIRGPFTSYITNSVVNFTINMSN